MRHTGGSLCIETIGRCQDERTQKEYDWLSKVAKRKKKKKKKKKKHCLKS